MASWSRGEAASTRAKGERSTRERWQMAARVGTRGERAGCCHGTVETSGLSAGRVADGRGGVGVAVGEGDRGGVGEGGGEGGGVGGGARGLHRPPALRCDARRSRLRRHGRCAPGGEPREGVIVGGGAALVGSRCGRHGGISWGGGWQPSGEGGAGEVEAGRCHPVNDDARCMGQEAADGAVGEGDRVRRAEQPAVFVGDERWPVKDEAECFEGVGAVAQLARRDLRGLPAAALEGDADGAAAPVSVA